MKNYIVNIKCELALPIQADSEEQAIEMAEDYELPKEYREDTFEIIEVIPEIEN